MITSVIIFIGDRPGLNYIYMASSSRCQNQTKYLRLSPWLLFYCEDGQARQGRQKWEGQVGFKPPDAVQFGETSYTTALKIDKSYRYKHVLENCLIGRGYT